MRLISTSTSHPEQLWLWLEDLLFRFRPGHGKANTKLQVSIEYNRNIRAQTVRWAMVDWLKDDHRGGLWEVRSFYLSNFLDVIAGTRMS